MVAPFLNLTQTLKVCRFTQVLYKFKMHVTEKRQHEFYIFIHASDIQRMY